MNVRDFKKVWLGNEVEDYEGEEEYFISNRYLLFSSTLSEHKLFRMAKVAKKMNGDDFVTQPKARKMFNAYVNDSNHILKRIDDVHTEDYGDMECYLSMNAPPSKEGKQYLVYVNKASITLARELCGFTGLMANGPTAPVVIYKNITPVGLIMPLDVRGNEWDV